MSCLARISIFVVLLFYGVVECEWNTTKPGKIGWKYRLKGERRCFRELGCFRTDGDFHNPRHRILTLLPESRDKINTRFNLYTRANPDSSQLIRANDNASLTNSTFQAPRQTKMIIHGFIHTGSETYIKDMTQALLLRGDYNVVVVDWSGGSLTLYHQASANIRVVGAETALLINYLVASFNARPKDFHLIGHSLGAHAAGYAGERVEGLGRITGLDPADPGFEYMPPSVRLDPSDAQFVDVVHTDGGSFLGNFAGGLGIIQPVGHVDFYPNGGIDQPGCNMLNLDLHSLGDVFRKVKSTIDDIVDENSSVNPRDLLSLATYGNCRHLRAVHLFIDSIGNSCPIRTYPCFSWKNFKLAKCLECGNKCPLFGFDINIDQLPANTTKQKLFFVTGHERGHYCAYHYQIIIKFGSPEGSTKQYGKLFLTLEDAGQSIQTELTKSPINLQPGKSYKQLVTSTSPVDMAKAIVKIKWDCESHFWHTSTWCVGRNPVMFIDKVKVFAGESQSLWKFCGRNEEMQAGEELTFPLSSNGNSGTDI